MPESTGAVIMWRAPFESAARTERIVHAYHVLVSFLRSDVKLVAVGADVDPAYRSRLQEEVNELNLTASRFASEGEELPTATMTLTPAESAARATVTRGRGAGRAPSRSRSRATPASRSRIQAPQEKEEDEFDRFLRGRGG